MILRNSMMFMVRLSTAQQDCCVIWDFNPQSEKCITWDWEKTAFRQYVSVNSQESYTLVSAVCQCIINVCLGCLCFFLSTHRWQEALTVYPRTNKQNQKKKRKVDPPTQQVTIGSPILNDDFEYPDRNWRIKITWLRSSMFLFVSNDAGFLNRKVSQLAFCCLFGFFFNFIVIVKVLTLYHWQCYSRFLTAEQATYFPATAAKIRLSSDTPTLLPSTALSSLSLFFVSRISEHVHVNGTVLIS